MIRVFPRRTKWTPNDDLAFIGEPPIIGRPPDLPVYVSCSFTWDLNECERLYRSWLDHYSDVQIYKPILYWKEWEIWDHIERYNLPYCSLYDEGFHRLGCVVCPFLCRPNQAELNKHRVRWPKIYAAFDRALRKFYLTGEIPSIRKMRMNNLWRISLGYLEPITWKVFRENWYLGKTNFHFKD